MYRLLNIESRAANCENPNGERSAGGKTRNGRKGAPAIDPFSSGQTEVLLDVHGSGMIRHIWMTLPPKVEPALRGVILRAYWDGQETPSIEVPIGDFFGIAHARMRPMQSELFSFLGGKGMNCWAPMPFRTHARITIENDSGIDVPLMFYHIDYTLGDPIEDDAGYFHAQFRRSNPQPMGTDYVILDNVNGKGRYLGTTFGVRVADEEKYLGWWGEGEVKMYLDGETQPTLCGTGTEDYIGFAWGLSELCAPQSGCPLCDNELGLYSIYRLHTLDPIYFADGIRVTVQQIGFGSGSRAAERFGADFVRHYAAGTPVDGDMCYFEWSFDCCSVAYWYQTLPTAPFPVFPNREERSRNLTHVRDALINPADPTETSGESDEG